MIFKEDSKGPVRPRTNLAPSMGIKELSENTAKFDYTVHKDQRGAFWAVYKNRQKGGKLL